MLAQQCREQDTALKAAFGISVLRAKVTKENFRRTEVKYSRVSKRTTEDL